ncbi:MAG: TRAP transporter substrate-binding protein, partial [Fidelibacterota bacterium]
MKLGILLMVVLLTACTTEQPIRVLKLAHVLDTTHPVHRGMVYMAEKLAEKSGGRMRVDIYPGGQLGQE